jgi:hypothetical protein
MLAAAEQAINGGGRTRIIAALRRLTGAQVDDQPRSDARTVSSAGVRVGRRAGRRHRGARRSEDKPLEGSCTISAVRFTRHLHDPARCLSKAEVAFDTTIALDSPVTRKSRS